VRTALKRLGITGSISIGEWGNLPQKVGVYIFRDSDYSPLYVGKAKNLRHRLSQYTRNMVDRKIKSMVSKAVGVEYIVTDTEAEALILECNLIKHLKPRYNINLADDKRYPYLCITNEDYPRIFLTRRTDPSIGEYLGPFTNADALRRTIRLLQGILKIRTCRQRLKESEGGRGPCLNYHMGRCDAPCQGGVSVDEYKKRVLRAREVLKGRGRGYISELKGELDRAVRNLEFERASKIRANIVALEEVITDQKVEMRRGDEDIIAFMGEEETGIAVIFKVREGKLIGREVYALTERGGIIERDAVKTIVEQRYSRAPVHPSRIAVNILPDDTAALEGMINQVSGRRVRIWSPKRGRVRRLLNLAEENARLILREELIRRVQRSHLEAHRELGRLFGLDAPPATIDGIDISLLSKTGRVGASVRFELGRPVKKHYRRYRIRGKEVDDVGMMVEVVRRKIERGEVADVLLLDGGRGQLMGVYGIFANADPKPALIAIAKGKPDKFYVIRDERAVAIRVSDNLRRLLVRIRDEAHRFAHSYQLKTRKFDVTKLDDVRGLSRGKRDEVLRMILMEGIDNITVDKLMRIRGVGKKVAEGIMEVIG